MGHVLGIAQTPSAWCRTLVYPRHVLKKKLFFNITWSHASSNSSSRSGCSGRGSSSRPWIDEDHNLQKRPRILPHWMAAVPKKTNGQSLLPCHWVKLWRNPPSIMFGCLAMVHSPGPLQVELQLVHHIHQMHICSFLCCIGACQICTVLLT